MFLILVILQDGSLYDATRNMQYLDMVIQESLRLYPPIPKFVSFLLYNTLATCIASKVHVSESEGGSQEAELQLSTVSVSGPYLKCLEHIGSTVLNFHVPLIIRMSYVLLVVSQLYHDSEIKSSALMTVMRSSIMAMLYHMCWLRSVCSGLHHCNQSGSSEACCMAKSFYVTTAAL